MKKLRVYVVIKIVLEIERCMNRYIRSEQQKCRDGGGYVEKISEIFSFDGQRRGGANCSNRCLSGTKYWEISLALYVMCGWELL